VEKRGTLFDDRAKVNVKMEHTLEIDASDALVVVDLQQDFCPGGALAVNEGDTIIAGINAITPRFTQTVFTRDWHPANHSSFSAAPKFVDKSWPPHCVAKTAGADFHPALEIPGDALIVSKGSDPAREAYSGFDGTTLAETLHARGVRRVFVCGLATDYCVKATALDAVKNGFETILIEDLCRGVDNPPGAAGAAIAKMKSAGVSIRTMANYA